MKSRAKVGGERGVNGEWYEGGKFLPSTKLPKRSPTNRKKKGPSKGLVEPGVIGEIPEGKNAIFAAVSNLIKIEDDGKIKAFDKDHPCWNSYDYNEVERLSNAYNNGERFFDIE